MGTSCRIYKYMKKIIIRAIGRLPEPWAREAEEVYVKRLKPYSKVEVIELSEGQKGSAKPDPEQVKKKEAESLLKGIADDAIVIALDQNGTAMKSEALASKLETIAPGREIIFCIGGSWGLHASVRNRADLILSFGPMTLPHALARIMLLEQLYRAEAISRGKEYHK